jgi:phosphoribosylaminoimidazole-succinocarboxamide synthase
MPLTKKELEDLVGKDVAYELEKNSIDVYEYARNYAQNRGIIIADTKFEFGFIDGKLSLIDELLTPDSSRFWDKTKYKIGQSQPSYDKQPVRDWLTNSGWNKEPPVPILSREIIEQTSERYRTAYRILTGKEIQRY